MPHPSRSLPGQPNLRFLKLEAKRRLAAAEFSTLHDAQLAIAREHGQPSWTALRQLINSRFEQQLDRPACPMQGRPLPAGGMLLWINGPGGVGKTATAFELNRRLPGSVVSEPEHVAFGMHRMLPAALRSNWWDLPALRHSVVELLRLTLAACDGPVIVPMMLVNSGYFQEVVGSLRADGLAVHHFALLAEPATVRRRLGRRSLGTELKPGSWALEHLSEDLQQLRAPQFAQHIRTDQQTVAQVADAIASSAGLAITPSTDGPLRASLRRYATTIRHVRLN
jgi:hypothetical protein